MNKAKVVFEKIALSNKLIFAAAKKSKKLVKSLTGGRYKPKSFEEFGKIQAHWHKKMSQRDFFNSVVSKIKG